MLFFEIFLIFGDFEKPQKDNKEVLSPNNLLNSMNTCLDLESFVNRDLQMQSLSKKIMYLLTWNIQFEINSVAFNKN